MIYFESMDSIELRHESAIAFTPELEGFRVDDDIVKKLISFYKRVSKDKNTTLKDENS